MSQHIPVDDILDPDITEQRVRTRIDDWFRRLEDLMTRIKNWAASRGWSVEPHTPRPMREDLMERFGLPLREQPSLKLRSPQGGEVWIWPKGLWVIGANGRVDIFSRKGVYVLIDLAEPFQPPQWVLHRLGEGKGRPFDPEQFAEMG